MKVLTSSSAVLICMNMEQLDMLRTICDVVCEDYDDDPDDPWPSVVFAEELNNAIKEAQ